MTARRITISICQVYFWRRTTYCYCLIIYHNSLKTLYLKEMSYIILADVFSDFPAPLKKKICSPNSDLGLLYSYKDNVRFQRLFAWKKTIRYFVNNCLPNSIPRKTGRDLKGLCQQGDMHSRVNALIEPL